MVEHAAGELRPLSTRRLFGRPRTRTSSSSNSTTWKALKFTLGTIKNASRVWQSTTVKIRNGRPSTSPSGMKYMAQTSLGPPTSGRPCR